MNKFTPDEKYVIKIIQQQEKAKLAILKELLLKDMNHFFKCYEAVVPRIKKPTAICEITGIT